MRILLGLSLLFGLSTQAQATFIQCESIVEKNSDISPPIPFTVNFFVINEEFAQVSIFEKDTFIHQQTLTGGKNSFGDWLLDQRVSVKETDPEDLSEQFLLYEGYEEASWMIFEGCSVLHNVNFNCKVIKSN